VTENKPKKVFFLTLCGVLLVFLAFYGVERSSGQWQPKQEQPPSSPVTFPPTRVAIPVVKTGRPVPARQANPTLLSPNQIYRTGEARPAPGTWTGEGAATPAVADAPNSSGVVQTSTKEKSTFDPVKENGPIFVNWPKPAVAMVLTGGIDGYIEPCGCAGLDRMKGGMNRRYAMLDYLRKTKGWEVAAIDVGNVAHGFGKQAEYKHQAIMQGYSASGYDVVGIGSNDLKLQPTFLLAVAANAPPTYLSTNVGLFGFASGSNKNVKAVKRGGLHFVILSVVGDSIQSQIKNPNLESITAAKALGQLLPKIEQLNPKPDYIVLMVDGTLDESKTLAKAFPAVDIIVTTGGLPNPPALPAQLKRPKDAPQKGTQMLIQVGHKGMDAVVLGFYPTSKALPIRYQNVPLDSRFPNSQEMIAVMQNYQNALKADGFSGLGAKPLADPRSAEMGGYIGSKKCMSCHEGSYIAWKKTPHAKAFTTLTEKTVPPRPHDPECVSCHVTGWNPQQYFPYKTGYESVETTPHLMGTGCETCHGPGEKHAEVENKSRDKAELEKYRKLVKITKEAAEKQLCTECHDGDNSPGFDFKTYWPKVVHSDEDD